MIETATMVTYVNDETFHNIGIIKILGVSYCNCPLDREDNRKILIQTSQIAVKIESHFVQSKGLLG